MYILSWSSVTGIRRGGTLERSHSRKAGKDKEIRIKRKEMSGEEKNEYACSNSSMGGEGCN